MRARIGRGKSMLVEGGGAGDGVGGVSTLDAEMVEAFFRRCFAGQV